MEVKRYVLVADISGFSNIVTNLEDDKLIEKISDWTTLVEALTKKYNLNDFQIISDTLMIIIEDNDEELQRLILLSKELLEQSVKQSLLIRGAISYGLVHKDKIIYGRPVINAHKFEEEQDWLGIMCDLSVFKRDTEIYSKNSNLICYPVPFKNLEYLTVSAIMWDIPSSDDLLNLFGRGGLAAHGDTLKWNILRKINNTLIFNIYCKMVLSKDLPKNKFYSMGKLNPLTFLIG